jgi:hypothetical protein
VAPGVGIVRLFIASGNGKDPLFAEGCWRKVETTRLTRSCPDGRQRTRETALGIDIFAHDETGIGREAATSEVALNRFVPNRCKEEGGRLTLSRERRVPRIATWDQGFFGVRSVQVDSLLKW